MNFTEKRSDQIGLTIIITLVVLIVFLFSQISWFKTGVNEYSPQITVTGEGVAFAVPDTATFSYTVTAEADTAATAQAEIAEANEVILSALAEANVNDNDIKTQSFNVYPRYEFRQASNGSQFINSERVLVGYEATQTNQVRVRVVDQASDLLGQVSSLGADNVSSLDFIVWDETAVESEARELAIADARAKALELADQLGVSLGDITDFYEDSFYYEEPRPFDARLEMAAFEDEMIESVPASVSIGENEVRKTVNISFELK